MCRLQGIGRCCGKRAIRGQDFGCFLTTLIIYIFYCVLTCVLLSPESQRVLTPYVSYGLTITTCLLCLILYFLAGVVDPGYLPTSKGCRLETRQPGTGIVVPYMVGELAGTSVYCTTCNIFRPPGTSHCDDCGHCIVYFDHHCPWVGTDVGIRNYSYFVFSMLGILLYCGWILVHSIICFVTVNTSIATMASCVLCALGSLFGIFFSIGMGCANLRLIFKDTTTRAYKRGRASATEQVKQMQIVEVPANEGSLAGEDSDPSTNSNENGSHHGISKKRADKIIQSIQNTWTYRHIRHPGWRRVFLGRHMPRLLDLPAQEAEEIAWLWTVVLCSDDPLI